MADRMSSAHARHDAELVAGCPACDALAPGLAAISTSLASLRGGTDSGHRDFRITSADARRLRRGRGLRAWLRPVAGPGFAFAPRLGGALTVVALIGLLASSLPRGLAAGGALEVTSAESSPGRELVTEPPRVVASPSAGLGFDSLRGSPTASASDAKLNSPMQPTVAASHFAGPLLNAEDGPVATSGILLASLVLLPIGLLLVAGRGFARRLMGAAREP